jgi:uncharacterized protein YcgL (UPF0745 family)
MTMRCRVFRSEKKAETYLYLSDGLGFDELPAGLRETFGEPSFVMELELDEKRRLARIDVRSVIEGLAGDGYYLQLPPKLPIEEEIRRRL